MTTILRVLVLCVLSCTTIILPADRGGQKVCVACCAGGVCQVVCP